MPSIWPFVPEIGATETFEYYTEVLKSYNKEQRIKLREKPRYILDNTYFLDDEQFTYAKAIVKAESQTGSYKVPVWQEAYKFSGTINSAATTITIDTTKYKFYGTELILWKDWDNYVVCTIASQTTTQITLSAAVGTTIVDPFVVPLKTMRTLQGITTRIGAPNINYMGLRFTALDYPNYTNVNTDVFSETDLFSFNDIYSAAYPSYKSRTAIVNPPFRVDSLEGSIVRPVELVDNGFGPIAVEATSSFVEERFVIDFFYQGIDARVDTLGLLCQFYGKQRSFYLPTFTKDVLLRSGTFSSTSLTIAPIGATTSYVGKNLFIKQLDGSYQFATVTACVVSGADYSLTLEAPLSSPVSNTLTDYISFMKLSRFDSDSLEITTGAAASGKVTINSVEVPN